MKLELKHLKPYLPYNLKVEYKEKITILDALDSKGGAFVGENRMVSFVNLKHVRPILRPLSSMIKEEASDLLSIAVFGHKTNHDDIDYITLYVENDNYIVISGVFKSSFYEDCRYNLCIGYNNMVLTVTSDKEEIPSMVNLSMYEYLFENHFDVFGLINNALAIEKK